MIASFAKGAIIEKLNNSCESFPDVITSRKLLKEAPWIELNF
jgi:hypothetical protein